MRHAPPPRCVGLTVRIIRTINMRLGSGSGASGSSYPRRALSGLASPFGRGACLNPSPNSASPAPKAQARSPISASWPVTPQPRTRLAPSRSSPVLATAFPYKCAYAPAASPMTGGVYQPCHGCLSLLTGVCVLRAGSGQNRVELSGNRFRGNRHVPKREK